MVPKKVAAADRQRVQAHKQEKAIFAQRITAMSDFKPYLQSAHIEGYKSIVSCDVTFKPGLNIIIGKNGSGKTNLLEAVELSLDAETNGIHLMDSNLAATIVFRILDHPNKIFSIRIESEMSPPEVPEWKEFDEYSIQDFNVKKQIFEEGELDPILPDDPYWDRFSQEAKLFAHAIPKQIPLISDMESGWIVGPNTARMLNHIPDAGVFSALQVYVTRKLVSANKRKQLGQDEASQLLINELEEFNSLVLNEIKQVTPITNTKVQEGRITQGTIVDQFELKGYHFLFEINGIWQPFQNLSDGTKRAFLIAVEAVSAMPSSILAGSKNLDDYRMRLFLLEEPELGIHPHQLHQLMNFLKEQSQEKQIIITTHSPQVLDILNQDELDRIIIAEFDPEKGSTFRHLTEKEEKKARFIMKDEPLSSYWRYSDLERSLAVK